MSATFIDIHNHSLPNLDDGAKSLTMALKMLWIAQDSGTSEVVLTPHHLNGAFYNHQDQILNALFELENARSQANIEIKLHVASEVHLVPEAVSQLKSGKALTYNNQGKYALIEPPKRGLPAGFESTLSQIIGLGIIPIIAHPERNSVLAQNSEKLKTLINMGCKSQITAQSITGEFGSEMQKSAHRFISLGLTHFVASDAHRANVRTPDLRSSHAYVLELFGKHCANQLFYLNPKAVVYGLNVSDLTLPQNQSSKPTKKSSLLYLLTKKVSKRSPCD